CARRDARRNLSSLRVRRRAALRCSVQVSFRPCLGGRELMANIRSMTGFGTGSAMAGPSTVRVEVRSVNGRFMELQIRLPRPLQTHEFALRELVQGKVGRGSVTVQSSLEDGRDGQAGGVDWTKLAEELR